MTRRKRKQDEWDEDNLAFAEVALPLFNEATAVLEPLPLADDWTPAQSQGVIDGPTWREHRHLQVERTRAFLYVRAHSDPAGDPYSVQEAANMLRALPGAPLPELLHGRLL